jgi:putative endopeptidase
MLSGDTLRQAMSEEGAALGIEKALARASTKRAESADPDKRYHMYTLADREKLAPDFDFRVYFSHVTTRPIETLNVANPDYVKTVDELISPRTTLRGPPSWRHRRRGAPRRPPYI